MCLFGGGGNEDSAPKPAPPAETLDQAAPTKKTPSESTIFDKKTTAKDTKSENPLTIHKNKPTVSGQTKKKMPTNKLSIGSKKYQNDVGSAYSSDVFPNGLTIN